MRVLVIGGSGFIGSHVVDALLSRNAKVRVFDRSPERFRPTPPEVDLQIGDFDDTASLLESLYDVDIVFHLLSTTVPSTSNLDPVGDIAGNLIGTLKLLEAMRFSGVKRILYLSSGGTIYGAPKTELVREDHPQHPLCSYGIVKSAIEKYLYMEQHLHGLEPIVIRASNPYGPRQGHGGVQGVIGTFLWRIANEETIQVWGDGRVIRDFIHVKDLASSCILAAEQNLLGTFNVGSGQGHSILEVLQIAEMVAQRSVNVDYKPARAFDIERVVLDIEKIASKLDWRPRISLTEGIADTWKWIQEKKNLVGM